MVRIAWAQLCEMPFLDDCDRLCVIGVMTRFPAPQLPIAMRQVVIVVRIAELQTEETFGIGVSMLTPCGVSLTPPRMDGVDIAITPEYIFITLRDIPFAEEGIHRFTVTVGEGEPVCIDVPVRLGINRAMAGSNSRHNSTPAFQQPSSVPEHKLN